MDDESRRERVLETLRELSQKTTNSERLKVQHNEPEELLSIVYHALESSINAIIITDLKEKIKYVNPSFIRMFGYQNKDQALNDDAAGLFDQNRIKRLTDVIWIIDKQQGNTQEFNARRIDGGEFPVLVSVSNINDMKGNLIGRMASFVDLTERKQAQKLLGESKRHIQILSSKLLEAEEEARKMIGKDLHDTIGSGLTAIKYALEKYITDMEKEPIQERSTLQQVVSMVQNTISETKRICRSLRPTALDDLGIIITVDGFCREFQKIHSGIRVERDIEIEENEVPDPLKIQIYRILQEALNNVVKHSGANLVRISLKKKEGNIEMLIQDNGIGFDQQKNPFEDAYSSGMGLDTMKERVERYGGAWKIISSVGEGTIIKCLWPFS